MYISYVNMFVDVLAINNVKCTFLIRFPCYTSTRYTYHMLCECTTYTYHMLCECTTYTYHMLCECTTYTYHMLCECTC